MLSFNNLKELQDCEELQNMCRFEWREVILNGKTVIACTTNEQYENILWSGLNEVLEELMEYYGKDCSSHSKYDMTDLTSEVRDFVLEKLDKEFDMRFVDVYDFY